MGVGGERVTIITGTSYRLRKSQQSTSTGASRKVHRVGETGIEDERREGAVSQGGRCIGSRGEMGQGE